MSAPTVLVIDDSDIDQFIAKHMLEKCAPTYSVLQAFDGQEALDALVQIGFPPKLIILDINMPRMNGLEFLVEYEKSNLEKANVVMLTSSFQDNDRDKCLAHKCVKQYLTKPANIENFERLFQ
jgi:CheY-like chemotaxis protein